MFNLRHLKRGALKVCGTTTFTPLHRNVNLGFWIAVERTHGYALADANFHWLPGSPSRHTSRKAKLCGTVSLRTSTSVATPALSQPTWQQPASLDVISCWSCGRSLRAPFKKATALAVTCCCASGVATESIGNRCMRSTLRKELVANAQQTKVKLHSRWGNGSEATQIECAGNAQDATAMRASHINATSAGSGFRRRHSRQNIAETKAHATVYAARAKCRNRATGVRSKNQWLNTRRRPGRHATSREEFARHAWTKALGRAPPVTYPSRIWRSARGCATDRPAKTEPRSATNATAQRNWYVSPQRRGNASSNVERRYAAARFCRRSERRSKAWSAAAAHNRSNTKAAARIKPSNNLWLTWGKRNRNQTWCSYGPAWRGRGGRQVQTTANAKAPQMAA